MGRNFPMYDLFLIVVGPAVLGLLWMLLTRTRWGTLVRAATQDREMVGALGVNQAWLFTAVFALGAMLAGLGGALQLPREQELQRRQCAAELQAMGIDPWPAEGYEVNVSAAEIREHYPKQKIDFKDVSIAGRLMSRRIMGNASFAELQDESGRIQVYFRRDDLCPGEDKSLYNTVFKKLLDNIQCIECFADRGLTSKCCNFILWQSTID